MGATYEQDTAATGDASDVFGLVGCDLDGKFRVEGVVAEGGFGVVYRGTHLGLHKPVAIKVLKTPPTLNDAARSEFLAKFALEARTIAALDHPAIVRVLDFGASMMPQGEASPWMVMEWLAGTSLESELETRRGQGGRSPAECLAVLRPVFDALAAAHDERIAHRDIKPANMMLVRGRRGDAALKLLDFGIAKLMRPEEDNASGRTATQSGMPAYSLYYAAPEQIAGTRTGPWTDVHAMALVLVEMLTDATAYTGTETTEVYGSVLSPQRPTPAKFGLDVGAWEAVLVKALALKPTERFGHAGQFLAALEANVPASAQWATAAVPAIPGARLPDANTTLRDAVTTTERRAPVNGSKMPWAIAGIGVASLVAAVAVGSVLASRSPNGPPRATAAVVTPTVPEPAAQVPVPLPAVAAQAPTAQQLAVPSVTPPVVPDAGTLAHPAARVPTVIVRRPAGGPLRARPGSPAPARTATPAAHAGGGDIPVE